MANSSIQVLRITPAYVWDGSNAPFVYRGFIDNTPVNVNANKINFYGYSFYNPNSSAVFVKIFNSTLAPVVGITSPIKTIPVPASGGVVLNGTDLLYYFSFSMWIAVTTGIDDSDNTAPTSTVYSEINYMLPS